MKFARQASGISIHSAIASGDAVKEFKKSERKEFQSTPLSLAETISDDSFSTPSINFNPLRYR